MARVDDVMFASERLVIRRLRLTDSQTVHAYKNDPDVARFQGWELPYPLEMVRADIDGDANRPWPCPGEGMNIAIEHAGEVVGDLYVAWDGTGRAATIGYTVASVHQGNGFATEAVSALVDHLFAGGIERVNASVDPANLRSIAVLDRVGFRPESIGRIEVRGEWVDDATYALTPNDRALSAAHDGATVAGDDLTDGVGTGP